MCIYGGGGGFIFLGKVREYIVGEFGVFEMDKDGRIEYFFIFGLDGKGFKGKG